MEHSVFPLAAVAPDSENEPARAATETAPAPGAESTDQSIHLLAALEDEGELEAEFGPEPEDSGRCATVRAEEPAPWLESEFRSWVERISGDLAFADSVERDLRLATPLGQ